ncbi:hypothetical protein [Ottowia testudinis]|uniref:Uncharacterized protein n=1 Tax=Ottowia testudinis TaxID=2816950 RepID=A0A975CIZ8_9BURK|nr:hypothetical protein [Ottowia testudinis]QTD47195.1 hypothetical protein J1M35_10170 [Ottowia testudinis]
MKAPAPNKPLCCLDPQTFRVLDGLKKTPLGSPANRLCIGCFRIAFHDGVLLIENGAMTQLSSALTPEALQIVIGDHKLVIDMWQSTASTVILSATKEELAAARTYFQEHGFAISFS